MARKSRTKNKDFTQAHIKKFKKKIWKGKARSWGVNGNKRKIVYRTCTHGRLQSKTFQQQENGEWTTGLKIKKKNEIKKEKTNRKCDRKKSTNCLRAEKKKVKSNSWDKCCYIKWALIISVKMLWMQSFFTHESQRVFPVGCVGFDRGRKKKKENTSSGKPYL